MAPASLMEAIASLGVQALALATLLSAATGLAVLAGSAWDLHAELFRQRQVEHLLEGSSAQAGSGPAAPSPVASSSGDSIVLHADLDGDGAVETTSAERTEVELRTASATSRSLHHRIGRQSIKVAEDLPGQSLLRVIGIDGTPTAAALATAISVPLTGGLVVLVLPARLP